MYKRLFIADFPKDYNQNTDIILGPWCIKEQNLNYQDFQSIKFEADPFTTIAEKVEADRITRQFTNWQLNILANELNEINHTNYSINYWSIQLMPWLLTLVQSIYIKQLIILKVIKDYKSNNVSVDLFLDEIEISYINLNDFFINGLDNIVFIRWIFSKMIQKVLPNNWEIVRTNNENNIFKKETIKNNTKDYFSINELLLSNYGFGKFDLCWLRPLLFFKSKTHKIINRDYKTIGKPNINWLIDWEHIVKATMPSCLKKKNKIDNLKKCGVIITKMSYENDSLRNAISNYAEKGAVIAATQHGGGYGLEKCYSLHMSEYQHDYFISWGWDGFSDIDNINIVSLPTPYLSKMKRGPRREKIIFVNSRLSLTNNRIMYSRQPNENIEETKNIMKFIGHLNANVLNQLWYRPFPTDENIINEKKYIKEIYPKIEILNGDLLKFLTNCKLLIVNYPETTLNIALALNIPTICYWDQNEFPMHNDAKPYFKSLQENAILFDNFEQAAQQANTVSCHIEKWWFHKDRQAAVKEWASKYAKTSKYWRIPWAKWIWKL